MKRKRYKPFDVIIKYLHETCGEKTCYKCRYWDYINGIHYEYKKLGNCQIVNQEKMEIECCDKWEQFPEI